MALFNRYERGRSQVPTEDVRFIQINKHAQIKTVSGYPCGQLQQEQFQTRDLSTFHSSHGNVKLGSVTMNRKVWIDLLSPLIPQSPTRKAERK